ncbi:MAG: hypothetical protein C9356_12485 [Oleiphilus sp.]|nr:MAG: hypothetical protein C9356_12485 [Oleiphilus sp.]
MSQPKKVFVKPAPKRKPRHPDIGRNIEPSGEYIVDSPTLRRMIRDQDVLKSLPNGKTKRAKKPGSKPADKGASA